MSRAIAALIALTLLGTAVYAEVLMENTAIVTVESPEKAVFHAFVLFPDGFRHAGKYEVAGKKSLALYLGSAKSAWMNEYRKNGRLSQPLILLVAVSEKGVDVKGVNLDWDDLRSEEVKLKFREDEKVKKAISKLEQPQPLSSDLYWAIEDYYEYTLHVVLSYVKPDSSTWGVMDFFYGRYLKVGFAVNTFINSWSVAGYNIIQKRNDKGVTGPFDVGDDCYIWMNVRYRYEKWVYYLDDDPILTMEHVYVKDFYPETITAGTSKPTNARLVPVDSWSYIGSYTARSSTYPYYLFNVFDLTTDHLAIDCLKFIDALVLAGKISGRAATAAGAIGLFVDVDFEYDNVVAFDIDLALYSYPGTTHTVYMAESEAVKSVPAVYFEVH
ncbi:MAG: hypothetical protein H0Z19_05435 [Archaeoglobus sp.]|uniref:hypothetical protein n=1 Tax=Archaeoglobus sp. TaxID=1872626 RepID=UPI001DD9B372|nr:hypothetical protein [Archaeoglobus sp.]MBO8179910.1 hypothetical protein [Archaeoglobus sp.]